MQICLQAICFVQNPFVIENVLHECRQRPTGGFESIVYEFHMLFQNELSSSI